MSNIKIYLGKKSEEGKLICTVEKTKSIPLHYKATIEPNVDTIFALTIVFYFIKLFQISTLCSSIMSLFFFTYIKNDNINIFKTNNKINSIINTYIYKKNN